MSRAHTPDDAKQVPEGADAADEFRRALLLAPWWGDVT